MHQSKHEIERDYISHVLSGTVGQIPFDRRVVPDLAHATIDEITSAISSLTEGETDRLRLHARVHSSLRAGLSECGVERRTC